MKSVLHLCLALMALALLPACSSQLKVTTDYDKTADFSKYKTFGFYKLQTKGNISELNANRILNAIRNALISKGYTEENSNPDMLVNAVTYFREQQSVTASTNYYGYGGLYRPYGYWGGGMATGYTTYNTYNYTNGSLSIDIVDNASNKMIWQGVGNKDIDGTPKNPDEAINTAVVKILEGFPPKK